MSISGMWTTCCATFCHIKSSPERKRHWVGCTWPVSMYASGLCVDAALSRRWEWNTLSLSLAAKWKNLSHTSSVAIVIVTKKRKRKNLPRRLCEICLSGNESRTVSVWLIGRQGIFTTALCLWELKSAGKLHRDTLVVYKTSSCCSKKLFAQINSFYGPI